MSISYEKRHSFFGSATAALGALLVAAAAIAIGALAFNRKRKSTIREVAKVRGQTVEMLASGDEYRRPSSYATRICVPVLMRRAST